METIPLEMNDIFDDENGDEEDNYPRPLPDLPEELEPTQNTDLNVDAENDAVLSKLKDMKGAAKKTVRRPIPKLDARRLTGDRGIPIIPKLFEDIKFKGKGHEMQDLKLIMDKLEHWGHRLFPKLPFDEVLERVEKLGSKKEVQTCIKKMRQDLPILDDDFVGDKNEEETEEIIGNKNDVNDKQVNDLDAEEAFDEMMRKEVSQSPQPSPDKQISPPKTVNVLSEDQKERIERNKRLAMEKRLERLGQKSTGSPSSKPPVTPVSNNSQTSTPVSEPEAEGAKDDSNNVSSSVETLIQLESTSDSILEKQTVNVSESVQNSGKHESDSDNNTNKDWKEDMDFEMETDCEAVKSDTQTQSKLEQDSLKPLNNIWEEKDIDKLTNSKDKEISETSKDSNISKELECETENNENDIAMETDEQQTAEEILNDLDDI